MKNRSTIIDYLEIRRSKGFYIYILILFAFTILINIVSKSRRDDIEDLFYPHFTIKSFFFLLFFLSVILYFLFNLTDNKIKVKIDKDGIWMKKYDTIPWTDIWYVYSVERSGNGGISTDSLMIKVKESLENPEGKEIKILLSNLDKDLDEVMKTVTYFTQQYGIENLGHDKL